jgi:uncharacterized coiled-coil protein SlyX
MTAHRTPGKPQHGQPLPAETHVGWDRRITVLETRLEHLEAALEGLQDAVYRQSVREEKQLAELGRRTEPHEMARALSEDARRHGVWVSVSVAERRSWEVSGREEQSTEQIRLLFARYREIARGVILTDDDVPGQGELEAAPERVPATAE